MLEQSHHHRIKVYVGSTTKDLLEHRNAVLETIRQCGFSPLIAEQENIASSDVIKETLERLDGANAYIGLFGQRYGYVPRTNNPDQLSVSEMEYRRAVERGIPVMICLSTEETRLLSQTGQLHDVEETGAKYRQKLKQLKEEMAAKHAVVHFTTPEDLVAQVLPWLNTLQTSFPAEESAPSDTPSTSYIAHHFIASMAFFGRRAELRQIEEWAASNNTALIVQGIGGSGKSALLWQWFNSGALSQCVGRIWWSFCEIDATIGNFIRSALAYITYQPLDKINQMAPAARTQALLSALSARPYLLVLDGVERLLEVYHRMDAPYLVDLRVEQEAGQAYEQLFSCFDPNYGKFLAKLVSCAPSKIVLGSRLIPLDLRMIDGALLGGVRHLHLNGLAEADALALMRNLGVRGDEAALARLLAKIDYHTISLRLLAGKIAASGGDFDAWYKEEGYLLDEPDLTVPDRREKIVSLALNKLSSGSSKLLGQLAAFRFPIDQQTLNAVNPFVRPHPLKMHEPNRGQPGYAETKATWEAYQHALSQYEFEMAQTQELLKAAISDLEARGLLLHDGGRYDLHPAVRGGAFAQLEGEDHTAAFARIRRYYESLPPEAVEEAKDLSDLHRTIEVYYVLIGTGLLDRAAEFYRLKLSGLLSSGAASHYEIIELLRPLFPGGPGTLPALSKAADRGYFANELALALGYVGKREEALTLLGLAFGAFIEENNPAFLCAALLNYASLIRDDNQLAFRAHIFELARDLAIAAGEPESLALASLLLLKLYVDTGQWAPAEDAYRTFNAAVSPAKTDRNAQRYATAERLRAKMLILQNLDAMEALELAWDLAIRYNASHEQLAIRALRGELSLRRNAPEAAQKFFREAMTIALRIGVPITTYASGLAQALVQLGRLDEARALIGRGISRATAAKVLLALGEREKAARVALEAYKLAWADGQPFSFWQELKGAQVVLETLDVTIPVLRPFDPALFRLLPYESAIRQMIEAFKTKQPDGQ